MPEPAFQDDIPWDDGSPVQPYGATTFFSYGQYGSTVFDQPLSRRSSLEINICDSCLTEKGIAGRVAYVYEIRPAATRYEYEAWKPDGERQCVSLVCSVSPEPHLRQPGCPGQ